MRRRSTTLTKKPEDLQEGPKSTLNCVADTEAKNVKIYLRRANKTTKIVTIPPRILLNQIFVIVEKELDLPQNSQVLFFKGNKISVCTDSSSSTKTINFEQKDILHVHNSNPNLKPQLKVTLEYLSPRNQKFKQIICIMKMSDTIEDSLSKAMDESLQKIRTQTFIQSGRKLGVGKKPHEQFIEDGSIITVINKQIQVSKKQIAEQLQNILDYGVPQSKRLTRQSISLQDGLCGSPDFKKKQKVMCLYKSYRVPESKEIIWESDSSTQLNKRELIKNLYRKKANNEKQKSKKFVSISSDSSNSSPHNIFTLTDKMELKHQIKRLFQSDCLHNQTEIKKLQPPKFSNNDFFIEDVEEIQVNCEEKEDQSCSDSDSEEERDQFDLKKKPSGAMNLKSSLGDAKQLYSSLPLDLRKSIGKTKGSFSPVPLIPTRDFEDDNQMEI